MRFALCVLHIFFGKRFVLVGITEQQARLVSRIKEIFAEWAACGWVTYGL